MTSVYLIRDDKILLLYRIGSKVADQLYVGSAGGHFEEHELNSPRECILREMREELGLHPEDIADLRLRYITHRLKNGELRQNYYYFAKLSHMETLHSTEGILHWFHYSEIQKLTMPVSAKHMMQHYLSVGRYDDQLRAGITQEDQTVFYIMKDF